MSYRTLIVPGEAVVTTNAVLTKVINVEMFDYFSVQFQNDHSLITFLNITCEAALNSTGSPASLAPNFVALNTVTLPVPSALANSAGVITSAVKNCFKYLRFLGHACQTMSFGKFKVTVAGHHRLP